MERFYKFTPTPLEYTQLQKESICDSSGHFKFKNIANGSFFIITDVSWEISNGQYAQFNGGALMKKVTVQNGETQGVIMAQ